MKQNYIKQELGRSMVEMLGVLAIIGVLSVGGITGYTTAMNKHKANEILSAASVRAVAVSTQLQNGKAIGDVTLAEFGDADVFGANFGTVTDAGNNRFMIAFDKAPDGDVLKQMQNITGDNGVVRDLKAAGITYNNDLSADKIASDYKSQPDCVTGAGKYWCTDHCVESAADCGPTCSVGSLTGLGGDTGVTASDGTSSCYCESKGEVYDDTNGCQNNTKTDCKSYRECGDNQFCYFGSSVSCSGCDPDDPTAGSCSSGTGTCTAMTDTYAFPTSSTSITGIGSTWKGPTMDWYSANDWCQANDKDLITVEDVNCYRSGTTTKIMKGEEWGYCCATEQTCGYSDWSGRTGNNKFSSVIVDLASKYGTSFYGWTESSYGTTGQNSCYAFYVDTVGGRVNFSSRGYNRAYALCK